MHSLNVFMQNMLAYVQFVNPMTDHEFEMGFYAAITLIFDIFSISDKTNQVSQHERPASTCDGYLQAQEHGATDGSANTVILSIIRQLYGVTSLCARS